MHFFHCEWVQSTLFLKNVLRICSILIIHCLGWNYIFDHSSIRGRSLQLFNHSGQVHYSCSLHNTCMWALYQKPALGRCKCILKNFEWNILFFEYILRPCLSILYRSQIISRLPHQLTTKPHFDYVPPFLLYVVVEFVKLTWYIRHDPICKNMWNFFFNSIFCHEVDDILTIGLRHFNRGFPKLQTLFYYFWS